MAAGMVFLQLVKIAFQTQYMNGLKDKKLSI